MFGTIATTALALITQLLPYLSTAQAAIGGASTIAKIISMLEALVPAIIQEAKDLYPTIKHIIETMRGSSVITKEQLDQLDVIEAKIDSDFDAAVAAAKAEDDAASKAT